MAGTAARLRLGQDPYPRIDGDDALLVGEEGMTGPRREAHRRDL
jgi:hypothetical protein